jgi:hypothetical protein
MSNARINAVALACIALAIAVASGAAYFGRARIGIPPAHAFEKAAGVLVSSGTSVNNTTTAAPFTVGCGLFAVQCDATAYVRAGSGSSTSVTATAGQATTGVKIAADALYDVPMPCGGTLTADTIAVVSASGTANCNVFQIVSM